MTYSAYIHQYEDTPSEESSTKTSCIYRRYIVVFMMFLGVTNMYIMRINLSVTIVAMTGDEGDFDWDSKQQGVALSSFFYGYIVTQLPGGIFSKKYPAHHVFGTAIGICSILTLILPFIAFKLYALVSVRVVQGLVLGVTYPSILAILSKWAPPLERSRMMMITNTGIYLGTVIAMPGSGLLSDYFGWESVFYVSGGLGIAWYILWLILVKESPEKDTRITDKEKAYIKIEIGTIEDDVQSNSIPWKSIFKSVPVWGLVIASFTQNWGAYTLMTQIPTFLSDTIDLKLSATGFYSALPYLTSGLICTPAGLFANFFLTKNILSRLNVRRSFVCIAFVLQCGLMLAIAYLMTPVGSITLLTAAIGISTFSLTGLSVNSLDLAPQFSMILYGISNTFGTIPGIVSPILTGFLVQNKVSVVQN